MSLFRPAKAMPTEAEGEDVLRAAENLMREITLKDLLEPRLSPYAPADNGEKRMLSAFNRRINIGDVEQPIAAIPRYTPNIEKVPAYEYNLNQPVMPGRGRQALERALTRKNTAGIVMPSPRFNGGRNAI